MHPRAALVALACLVCLMALAAAQFSPSPVDFLATDVDPVSLSNWQFCAVASSAFSADYAAILAKCGGSRLLIACAGNTPLLMVAAAANASAWTAGANLTSTLPPNAPFVVNTSATALYAGAGDPGTCASATGDGICFPLTGTTLGVGAYCGTTVGFVVSTSVSRVFYTNPCEGHAVNASCPSVRGLCGVDPRCGVNGTCDAVAKQPDPPTCVVSSSCDPISGNLTTTYQAEGAACFIDNFCIAEAACAANHSCVPTVYTICPEFIAPCLTGTTCNVTLGQCQSSIRPPGSLCSYATACHGDGACDINGLCVEVPTTPPPQTCGVPDTCTDFTGWTYTPAPGGTLCNTSNRCLVNTTCDGAYASGLSCTGPGVLCPTQVCRGPAYCNNATGACASQALAAGTPCDDGTPCTQGTTCSMIATCGGGVPALTCPSDPPLCYQYTLQALNATTCACVLVPRANGTGCDDGDICTENDRCTAGTCAGDATTCPGDDCNFPLGSCSPTTGCLNPRADYLACNSTCMINGQCQTGVCLGGTFNAANPLCVPGPAPRVSAALDAWLDDDAWAAARKRAAAALGVLYDVLPLIALGGGEGPDKHGWVPDA